MAEVTANGVRFHVQRLATRGAGQVDPPTIVFVHGLVIGNLSSFYPTPAKPVAHAGAEVILYDLRGHGLSERPPTGYAVSDSVADLGALLDALGICGSVHLVGYSYGGTVALSFAIARPERVASLVLVEAHVVGELKAERIVGIRAKLAQGDQATWRARQGRQHSRRLTTLDALVNGTTLVADLQASKPFLAEELSAVTCPVRVVYGAQSKVLCHAYWLEELLPRCTLTVLPGCTHRSVLTEVITAVRDILLAWLALEPAPPPDIRQGDVPSVGRRYR